MRRMSDSAPLYALIIVVAVLAVGGLAMWLSPWWLLLVVAVGAIWLWTELEIWRAKRK